MHNKYILCLFLFSCILNGHTNDLANFKGVFKKTSTNYILPLPYQISPKVNRVFDVNTHYAIEIIDMYCDGIRLIPKHSVLSFEQIYKINTIGTQNSVDQVINMYWFLLDNGDLQWTDKSVNCQDWIVPKGAKELVIHYKIALPFLFASPKKLRNRSIPSGSWTEIFSVTVDIINSTSVLK
jgi:hypothetical protein